jgi:hypothetical protein
MKKASVFFIFPFLSGDYFFFFNKFNNRIAPATRSTPQSAATTIIIGKLSLSGGSGTTIVCDDSVGTLVSAGSEGVCDSGSDTSDEAGALDSGVDGAGTLETAELFSAAEEGGVVDDVAELFPLTAEEAAAFFGIVRVSTWPQTEQVRLSSPVCSSVASIVVVHSPKVWPLAATDRVSVFPQTEHVLVSSPFSVQVGAFVRFHLPKEWEPLSQLSAFTLKAFGATPFIVLIVIFLQPYVSLPTAKKERYDLPFTI